MSERVSGVECSGVDWSGVDLSGYMSMDVCVCAEDVHACILARRCVHVCVFV